MKRKNVFSALLAVLMVFSMLTVITLPALAETGFTPKDLTNVAGVQTVDTADPLVTEFKISSFEDLQWLANETNTVKFSAEDTIYLATGLDLSGKTFGGLPNLTANFDGNGNTISNYNSAAPFFGHNYNPGDIQNVTFYKATVAGAEYNSVLVGKYNASFTVENVHVQYSQSTTTSSNYASLFIGMCNSVDIIDVTLRNCSVTNSTLKSTVSTAGAGFLTAYFRTSNGQLTVENCIVANNTMSGFYNSSAKYKNSLLVGGLRSRDEGGVTYACFKNVGVFNCSVVNPKGSVDPCAIILTTTGSDVAVVESKYIYAANNKIASTVGGLTADADITYLFYDPADVNSVSVANYYTVDPAVQYLEKTEKGSSTAVQSTNQKENYNLAAGVLEMNTNTIFDWAVAQDGSVKPMDAGENTAYTIQFTYGNNVLKLATDVDGTLFLNAETLVILQGNKWVKDGADETVPFQYTGWATKIFDQNTSFTSLPLTAEDYAGLPFASTAVKGDGIAAYKIDSVEELVKASQNIDMDDSSNAFACTTYEAEDIIYITKDLDLSTYQSTTAGNTFADDFKGFNAHAKGYCYLTVNVNGLGHTISNYTDTEAFFAGTFNGTVRNLIFENATVTASTEKSGSILMRTTEYGAVIDHVHIRNSNVTSGNPTYNAAMVGLVSNGGQAKDLTITNSSIIDTTVTVNADAAYANGLFMGAYAGRYGSALRIENCLAQNSTVQVSSHDTANGGGLLVGMTHNKQVSAMRSVVFKNIGVFNCTMESLNAGAPYSVVTTMNNGGPDFTYDKICAVGNVLSTVSNNAADDTAINRLFTNQSDGFVVNHGAAYTDEEVLYKVYKTSNGTITVNNGIAGYTEGKAVIGMNQTDDPDWGFLPNGEIVPLEEGQQAPYTIQFIKHRQTMNVATDVNGKMMMDAETLAVLKADGWTLSTDPETVIPENHSWEADTFSANAVYNMVPHELQYTSNGNGTHDEYCAKCDVHANQNCNFNSGVPVEATHMEAAHLLYTCNDCGYTKKDGYSGIPAPHTSWVSNGNETHMPACCDAPADTENCTYDNGTLMEATHSEAAYILYTCTKCGATKKGGYSGSPAPHTSWVSNGNDTHKPSCCDAPEDTENCTFDNGTPVAATHSEAAHKLYTCTKCGATKKADYTGVPAPHTSWVSNGNSTHKPSCCNVPGVSEACDYQAQKVNGTTCKEVCTKCGDTRINSNGVHGKEEHYYAPSLTTPGKITYVCTTCGGANTKYPTVSLAAGHPFPDVTDSNLWYYDEAMFCKAYKVFQGDGLGNFNPDSNITRTEAVIVLARMLLGELEEFDVTEAEMKAMTDAEFNAFLQKVVARYAAGATGVALTDVSGTYYERYAKLMSSLGIVNGYLDGSFGGDGLITREQLAAVLQRYVALVEKINGETYDSFGLDVDPYTDMDTVSQWAKGNVEWIRSAGLMNGMGGGRFAPQENTQRSQIAALVMRLQVEIHSIEVH